MILHRDRRTVPQLNTTSTADISFILLVFFLIMTSMDADKGLQRMLPPMADETQQEAADVERGNVLSLTITEDNRLTADGKPIDKDEVRRRVMSFVSQATDRRNHVIALDIDRKASYEVYFNVQNEIVAAYNELRNGYAIKRYGRAYAVCTPEQRAAVRAYYPQRITETPAATEEGGGR